MLPLLIAQVRPAPPAKLADVLPSIRWNAAERGPLLIIGAEEIPEKQNEPLTPGVPLNQLLPHFRRKLFRAGNVWVVGPENVVSVLGKMNPHGSTLLRLFGGLSVEQWKKLGSEAGLGRGDLPPSLRPVFDELLPEEDPLYVENASIDRATYRFDYHRYSVPLSPAQRAGARLHLGWGYEWQLAPRNETEKSELVVYSGETLPDSGISINWMQDIGKYGLFRQTPHKPKSSDLNFSALEQGIFLEGISTVKALIARIAQSTGLELYADKRLENLSVSFRGESARSGDVLQALCLGVGGAIRQVGKIYLLTEERVPWSVQTMNYSELVARTIGLHELAEKKLSEKLKKDAPVIRAAILALPEEPHPDTLSLYDDREYNAPNIPPSIQRRINALVEKNAREWAAGKKVPEALRSDGVEVRPELEAWLSLPDHGNLTSLGVDIDTIQLVQDVLLNKKDREEEPVVTAELEQSVRWPERWKTRIVRIAPKTPEEAAVQGAAARAAGFTELWLDMSVPQPQAKALVTVATKSGLPVTLVISPLARPPGTEGDGFISDLLISGETTDAQWRRYNLNLPEGLKPDSEPEPRYLLPADSVIEPVCELARIPGVKGLALIELNRPGYVPSRFNMRPEEGGGYILPWRQEFLRLQHIDPVDLFRSRQGMLEIRGSFFNESAWFSSGNEWNIFRAEQGQRWRQVLHARLRLANPQAQIFIRVSSYVGSNTGFFPWNVGAVLPQVSTDPKITYFGEFQAESSASPEQMRWQLNTLIRDDRGTRLLCDLTKVSPLPYLKELRQPAPPTSRRVAP